jgi:O-antigen ligase
MALTLAEPARAARWLNVARWAAIVAVCAVPLSPPVANVGMGITLLALLGSGAAWPRLQAACRQPLALGALAVLAIVALGMLWAEVPWRARWDAWWSWRKLLLIPVLLALFGDFAWKWRFAAAFTLVCGAGALAVFVVWFGGLPGVPHAMADNLLRNRGTQGMAFAVATLCAIWLAVQAAGWRRAGWLAAGALIAAAALGVTSGRSGHLALLIMVGVFALGMLRVPRYRLAVSLLALAVVAGAAFTPNVRERLAVAVSEFRAASAGQGELTSFGMRAVMYENTLRLVQHQPWIGVGTGGFAAAYAREIEGRYTDWRATPTVDPHNQYLFFVAELGLPGLLVFLGYILAAALDRGDGSSARWLAVAILLAWCATSLFSSHFKTFAEGHLLSMFLGVMLARPYLPRVG